MHKLIGKSSRAHLNAAEKRFRGEWIEKWEEKVGYNRLDLHLCGSNCNVIMKYTFWGSKCNDNQFVFSPAIGHFILVIGIKVIIIIIIINYLFSL